MNRKTDELYLFHIRDAIVLIEQWAKDKRFEDFMADEKLQSAIIRQLEIMRILPSMRRRYGVWSFRIFLF